LTYSVKSMVVFCYYTTVLLYCYTTGERFEEEGHVEIQILYYWSYYTTGERFDMILL
jgi:hypothetical protein